MPDSDEPGANLSNSQIQEIFPRI